MAKWETNYNHNRKGMITVEHLYKSFEDREVLKDINATFRDGEVNLIIGQSGSGKTVLMKNIVGLLTPTAGSIHYDDREKGEDTSAP